MKLKIFSVVALLACFGLGWQESLRVKRLLHTGPTPVRVHAQWASSAGTVAQQAAEADAIVRAHVVKRFKSRVLGQRLANPSDRLPAKFDVWAFTEVLLKVDKVYRGDIRSGGYVRVLQTGGYARKTADHPELQIALDDDPLLLEDSDHVFFLKEISGDPVLAPQRELYRIVNSAGRYDIRGDAVSSFSILAGKRPTKLVDLDEQIRAAL